MAAVPPAPQRRRPRRGSLERPINGRLYRGTWLLVALPLLIAAFSVAHPKPLPKPQLPPAFSPTAALGRARELATLYPDRSPGSPGAVAAARWVSDQLRLVGFETHADAFSAVVPGRGRVAL